MCRDTSSIISVGVISCNFWDNKTKNLVWIFYNKSRIVISHSTDHCCCLSYCSSTVEASAAAGRLYLSLLWNEYDLEGEAQCPPGIHLKRGKKSSWWKKYITVLSYKADFLKRIALLQKGGKFSQRQSNRQLNSNENLIFFTSPF